MKNFPDYFKTLTFRKFCNFIKIETSRILSFILNRPVVWGMPCTISIEPTCLCNLRCPECPTGTGRINREKTNLDLNLYRDFINKVKHTTLHVFLYFQGEPFMNRNIFEMITFASERKLYTVISTNGQFLDHESNQKIVQSGLNRLIISLDGVDQETYQKYRAGGDLNRILEGIKDLVAVKKASKKRNPEIIIQFLVFRHNENQIEKVKMLGKKTGVDRTLIKSARMINPAESIDSIPLKTDYSRYFLDKDGTMKIKSGLRNRCNRLWRTTVVNTDGYVLPCCFDKEGKYIMGDLRKNKFSEIWKSQTYHEFRKGILKNRKGMELCNNCTEGVKVFM